MEPIITPQTGNPPVPAPPPKRRHHLILIALAAITGSLYIAFNVWAYWYAKSGKAPSPAAIWQRATKGVSGFQGSLTGSLTGSRPVIPLSAPPAPPSFIPTNAGIQSTIPSTPSQIPTPTPTARPTGPGPFACSPDGTCNRYGEDARKQYCTVAFADSLCLDNCDDTSKRCTK